MEANPWAVVVFAGLLFTLDAVGVPVLRTGLLFVLFITFVPMWLLSGYVWDKIGIRNRNDD